MAPMAARGRRARTCLTGLSRVSHLLARGGILHGTLMIVLTQARAAPVPLGGAAGPVAGVGGSRLGRPLCGSPSPPSPRAPRPPCAPPRAPRGARSDLEEFFMVTEAGMKVAVHMREEAAGRLGVRWGQGPSQRGRGRQTARRGAPRGGAMDSWRKRAAATRWQVVSEGAGAGGVCAGAGAGGEGRRPGPPLVQGWGAASGGATDGK
jgi:hypothetical protein